MAKILTAVMGGSTDDYIVSPLASQETLVDRPDWRDIESCANPHPWNRFQGSTHAHSAIKWRTTHSVWMNALSKNVKAFTEGNCDNFVTQTCAL